MLAKAVQLIVGLLLHQPDTRTMNATITRLHQVYDVEAEELVPGSGPVHLNQPLVPDGLA